MTRRLINTATVVTDSAARSRASMEIPPSTAYHSNRREARVPRDKGDEQDAPSFNGSDPLTSCFRSICTLRDAACCGVTQGAPD